MRLLFLWNARHTYILFSQQYCRRYPCGGVNIPWSFPRRYSKPILNLIFETLVDEDKPFSPKYCMSRYTKQWIVHEKWSLLCPSRSVWCPSSRPFPLTSGNQSMFIHVWYKGGCYNFRACWVTANALGAAPRRTGQSKRNGRQFREHSWKSLRRFFLAQMIDLSFMEIYFY